MPFISPSQCSRTPSQRECHPPLRDQPPLPWIPQVIFKREWPPLRPCSPFVLSSCYANLSLSNCDPPLLQRELPPFPSLRSTFSPIDLLPNPLSSPPVVKEPLLLCCVLIFAIFAISFWYEWIPCCAPLFALLDFGIQFWISSWFGSELKIGIWPLMIWRIVDLVALASLSSSYLHFCIALDPSLD